MLNVLRINEISFGIEIEEKSKISKISCNQFICPVNEYVNIKFIISNNQGLLSNFLLVFFFLKFQNF